MNPSRDADATSRRSAVIKKEQVILAPPPPAAPPGDGAAGEAKAHQARIVESNESSALLEVQCACGNTIHIQCHFAGPATASPPPGGRQSP